MYVINEIREYGYFQADMKPDVFRLIYVCDGTLYCVINGVCYEMNRRQVCLCEPNQTVSCFTQADKLADFCEITFEEMPLNDVVTFGVAADSESVLLDVILKVRNELSHSDEFSRQLIEHYSKLMVMLMARLLKSNPQEAVDKSANDVEIVCRAQQYVTNNICEKMSVESMAANASVSASYMTMLFRTRVGISPGEYIRRAKLSKAKELIRCNQMNFSQIAETLNYSDLHHLSRQFSTCYHMTLSEYAKSI